MNLEAVRHACDVVASHVATAIAAQEDVLVLGGDCTVELGTVAGANAAGARIAFALKQLTALPQWRGLTITEINPAHAPDESAAFARLNEVLADALG
ncbi:MAG: hypothetical protein E5V21_15750 [Mesorhizobium sp.]|nr:MAG: hypothetical protein EOS34_27615 [Mesorhizobium sp.]TIX78743.1 MAG: hypothetical protein E5V21_15750 [Mesorhizobium sp.]